MRLWRGCRCYTCPGHNANILLYTERQQFVERTLVKQAVAAGEQKAVEIAFPGETGEHFPLVHAGADGADDAFTAEPFQRRIGSADGFLPMVIRIVDMQNVDAVDIKAAQAIFERAHNAIVAVVKNGFEGRWVFEYALVFFAAFGRH